MRISKRILILILLFFGISCSKRPNILINDFEGETFDNWLATRNAFSPAPPGRLWPLQARINGIRDSKAANSFHNGESSKGTLMSPKFKIERRYINFLVGGGEFPDSTGLHLIVDDEVVHKSTGNDQNNLEWQTWKVSAFNGKSAQIVIFDFTAGKMGYIIVDHIVQSDVSAIKVKPDLQKQFSFEKKYLMLPVKTGAQMRDMKIVINAQSVRRFDVELADKGIIDFWVFMDLSEFKGKTATIKVNQYWDSNPEGLEAVVQSDTVAGASVVYK